MEGGPSTSNLDESTLNENVSCVYRNRLQPSQKSEWQRPLEWIRSFFTSGKYDNAYGHQNKAQYAEGNAVFGRKSGKEVADQSGNKNSFSDIIKSFGDKFYFGVYHRNKDYHKASGLSSSAPDMGRRRKTLDEGR